jgi:hypothetical protein
MAGPTRISELSDGSPVQPTDQVPVARGSGATGYTYKVNAGRIVSDLFNVGNSSTVDLTFDTSTRTLCAAANIPEASVNVVDSPTIDLDWNASTRTLSADVSTAVRNASAFNVVGSPTIDLDWNASTRTLSAEVIGSFCFRNKLINAQGLINQRGYISGTATTQANQYTVDRWRVVTSGQNLVFSTSQNIVTFTAPAGGVEQVVEGLNVESGTYVLNWTGTATAAVNGTARTKGATFSLTGGSNVTVRFSSGTFSLPQLEKGNVSTAFEYRPIGTELALCQRYYSKSYPLEVPVGAISSDGIVNWRSTYNAANGDFNSVEFKVTMRAKPQVSLYSPHALNVINRWYDYTLGDGSTTRDVLAQHIGSNGFMARMNNVPVNHSVGGNWTADAEL